MSKEVKNDVVETNEKTASAEKAMKKGTVIQAVKAIAVLVIICLVCGILLALCNDLLYVSDDVKFDRAMQKIYPNFKKADDSPALDTANAKTPYGEVLDLVKSSDGAYILTAKSSTIGFSNGTVTVYVAVSGGENPTVAGWSIKENVGQSFIGNISEKHQKTWFIGQSITVVNPENPEGSGLGSGATHTENAIGYAINAAAYYCINVLKLVSTPESEAKDALVALLGTEYDGYGFVAVNDSAYLEACKVGDKELSFYFEGTKADSDALAAYVYGEDNARQIVVVKDGTTHAERLEATAVVKKSEGIDEELVAKAQSRSYFEYQVQKSHAGFEFAGMGEVNAEFATAEKGIVNKVYLSTDGAIIVEATGQGGFMNGTVTINVIIADREIKGWSIVSNTEQSYIGNIINSNATTTWYIGNSIDGALELGNNKVTDATWSSTAINNAINAACYYARNTLPQGGAE